MDGELATKFISQETRGSDEMLKRAFIVSERHDSPKSQARMEDASSSNAVNPRLCTHAVSDKNMDQARDNFIILNSHNSAARFELNNVTWSN